MNRAAWRATVHGVAKSWMTKGEQILRENQLNVYTPIRWDLAIQKLEELGVTEFFDVSANGAVSKFSRVSRKCKIYTLEDV